VDGFLDRISFLSDFLALISFLLRKVVSFLEELCGWELGRKEGRKEGWGAWISDASSSSSSSSSFFSNR
jgi:hypothetical protein